MRGRMRVVAGAIAVAVAGGGCFERGGGVSATGDDAGAAPAPLPAVAPPVDPAAPPDPGATVRVRLEAEPAHLNPLLAGDGLALRIAAGDIYEGLLCRPRPGAAPEPCLAESVTVEQGGTRVRATLRRGVSWQDGTPFSAEDVVFTYRLLAPPARIASWLASALDDLKDVRAVGDHQVELSFAGPRPGRRELLADVPILPAHLFASGDVAVAPANRAPVGTGPLRVDAWTPGESIELARWDHYWGTPAAAARIVYRVVPSRSRAIAMLGADALDVAPQLPTDEAIAAAAAQPHVIAYGYQRPAYLAAVYNLRHRPLGDVRARRALTMLLDRRTLAARFLGGAKVVSGPFVPGSPGDDPDVAPLPFDRSQATSLLGAVAPEPPRLMLLVPAGSRSMQRVADVWAADARGVARLVVDTVPYAEMLSRVRAGRFDVALMAFTTDRDPDLFSRFHSGEIGGENYGGLSDPELDRLLAAARSEPDAVARAALQRQIDRRLHELQPYAFITADTRAGLARDDIGGLARGAGLSARYLWKAASR